MAITKEKLRLLRLAMDAALAPIAKAHGLASLTAGHVTFDPEAGSFHFKVSGVEVGGLTPEQKRYDDNRWLGLPERGATFTHSGKVHTCYGLNTTGSKVKTTCSDGKRYDWPLEEIRLRFPIAPKAAGGGVQ